MANATLVKNTLGEELQRLARDARVFISMPCVPGVTPRILMDKGQRHSLGGTEEFQRQHGVFHVDEIGLPAVDHGLLYGDAVFEGVLMTGGLVFQWREHLQRLFASAERLKINVPYSAPELTRHILQALSETVSSEKGDAYVRLVVTRGIGDLGIHPSRCVGSTVYAIVSKLRLYEESLYGKGIKLAVSNRVKRASSDILDPRIKSCNYLNNITALLDTINEGANETLMLTRDGYIAEATTDNLFLVSRNPGWEQDSSKITISTPCAAYCLNGITRKLILCYAGRLGFQIDESGTMVADEIGAPEQEVFLTGTAAGLIPVVNVAGRMIGDGQPGPITRQLRSLLSADISDPAFGLSLRASDYQIRDYLEDKSWSVIGSISQKADLEFPKLIRTLFEKVDSRDWPGLREIFCDDIVYGRPGYEPFVGLDRLLKFYREERVIASGAHHLDRIVADQQSGACWGRFIGIHKNGSLIDERFSDVYTFKNGRILTRDSYFFRPAV